MDFDFGDGPGARSVFEEGDAEEAGADGVVEGGGGGGGLAGADELEGEGEAAVVGGVDAVAGGVAGRRVSGEW